MQPSYFWRVFELLPLSCHLASVFCTEILTLNIRPFIVHTSRTLYFVRELQLYVSNNLYNKHKLLISIEVIPLCIDFIYSLY